jgi:hypothetical protein
MEHLLGRDFGEVRVHSEPIAARMAAALRADAFTVGRDIYFGRGRAKFDTPSGMALLGHELTHVGQRQEIGRPRPGGALQAQDEEREALSSELTLRHALPDGRAESLQPPRLSMTLAGWPTGRGADGGPPLEASSARDIPSIGASRPPMELARAPADRPVTSQTTASTTAAAATAPATSSAAEAQAPEQQGGQVDVRALASQVYELIMRRLTVERERAGYI